ncbi:MAG: efflux RND transporter periplasmic adaptor subunit [Burkholderiales bacterium]|nr:efflux RND transporter periplasmic adaptor subunit [Burkholderiales bacterium]
MKSLQTILSSSRWTRPYLVALGAFVSVILTHQVALAQAPPVPTVAVLSKVSGVMVMLDGVIEPVKQSTVSAQASGRIVILAVKAGDKVRAGQTLASIDDREASVGVQRSKALVNQAEAELRNAQASLERTRDLQTKGFVSMAALDSANAQYQSALAMREQAVAGARQSGIAQGFTRVTAPFDGWILQTHAQAGDLAVPGKPLVTVYAPQPLRAVVQVPASRTQSVQAAMQTRIKVDGPHDKPLWISPTARTAIPSADPVSQTTEWRLDLPAKEAANLVPGQQVQVQFLQAQTGSVLRLTVPRAAVVRRGELTAVYVSTGQGFSLRAVRLGAQQGDESVEVLAGLKAGDEVALDPVRGGAVGARAAQPAK